MNIGHGETQSLIYISANYLFTRKRGKLLFDIPGPTPFDYWNMFMPANLKALCQESKRGLYFKQINGYFLKTYILHLYQRTYRILQV